MDVSFNIPQARLPSIQFSSRHVDVQPLQAKALLVKGAWGSDIEFFRYWKALFNHVDFGLCDRILQSIKADIEDCSLILEQRCTNVQALKNAIQEGLKKRSSFVFPLKVSKNGPSEFIMCRFGLGEDGRLRCRLMEKSLSPLHDFSGSKPKHAYCCPDIVFDHELDSAIIQSLLARLVRIHNEPHRASPCINNFNNRELPRFSLPVCDYTKYEIRELFLAIGRIDGASPILNNSPVIPLVSAWTPARNELEQGLKLILCDALYNTGMDLAGIKRVIWIYRRETIRSLGTDRDLSDSEKEAVKAFLARSKKLQLGGVISDQDLVTAFALSHELLANRNPSQLNDTLSAPVVALSQSLNDTVVKLRELDDAQLLHGGGELVTDKFELLQPKVPLRKALPEIESSRLDNYFVQCSAYCKERFEAGDYMEAYIFADRALKALPMVIDPFWDDLPEDQILGRLDDLKQLTAWGLDSLVQCVDKHCDYSAQDVLISYQSWAIAIRLLRRLPDLKLNGYHFVNLIPSQGPLTLQGEEGQRLLIIHNYLESLKEQSLYSHGLFDFSLKEKINPLDFNLNKEKDTLLTNKQYYKDYMTKGDTILAEVVKDRQFRLEPLLAYLNAMTGGNYVALMCYQSIEEPENAVQRGLGTLFHFGFLANLRRKDQRYRSKLSCNLGSLKDSFEVRWVANGPVRPEKTVNEIQRIARHSPPKDPNIRDLLIARHPSECTENDLMLREMPQPEGSILSRDLYHDLARMRVVQELQVHAALSGCLEHMEELDNPDIQAYLEVCFFEAAVIQRTCADDPEIMTALRAFLDQTIVRFFQNQDQAAAALFWIRIAYSFETHVSQLHPLDEERIRHLEKQLEELKNRPNNEVALSYEVLLTQLFFMGHLADLNEAQVMRLMNLWSERLTAEKPLILSAPWLEEAANILFHTHRERIREELSDHRFRQCAFSPLPFGYKEDTWGGEFPQYVKGDYTINLVSGKTYCGDLLLGNEWEEVFANHPDMIRLFGQHRPPVFCTPTRLQTQNGEYDCFLSGDEIRIYKWFVRDDLKIRYRYLSSYHGAALGIPSILLEGAALWQHAPSDNKYATHVLVVNSAGKAIASRECGSSNRLVRLDSKGVPNGQVLVNPEQLPEDIGFYVEKVSNPARTLLWAEQDQNSRWLLTTIEYPDVRLSFSIHQQSNHAMAICTTFPDCVLDNTQGIAFNGLKGAIQLRDSNGKPRLIVPCTEYNDRSRYLNGSENSPGAYFVYDYDPEGSRLIPSSDAAGFYLVYLYINQRLYHDAFAYLKTLSGVRLYDLNEWLIFCAIANLSDYTLQATAIRLQLANEIIQNSTLHVRERYHQERRSFDQGAFWRCILDDYTRILNHTGSGCQRLKEEMFLSSEEEKRLIVMLEKKTPFEVWNNNETVCKQWTAFFGRSAPAIQLEQSNNRLFEDITFSDEYQSNPIPDGLVRLWSGQQRPATMRFALPPFFLSLYEAARTAPSEKAVIDMDLQMLQYLRDKDSQGLLEILRRVRANPGQFPAYSQQSPVQFCNQVKEIAKQCTYRISEIPQSDRVPQIREIMKKERARPPRKQVHVEYSNRPLNTILEANFERQALPFVAPEPFALQEMNVGEDPLAAKLLSDLEKAHQTNLKRTFITYNLMSNTHVLKEHLESHLTTCAMQITVLKSQIERIVNSPLEDEGENTFTIQDIQRLSDRLCGRSCRITLQDLLSHFMIHDVDGVQKLNDSLSLKQVKAMFDLMQQYLLLQCEMDQAREALKFINQDQLIEAAEILDKERLYDPEALPELLVYEYATGKFLRPRQTEILQWIFRSSNPQEIKELLLEFEAGGGKTQVVAAILAFRYMMAGYLPIFFSLPELQDISKEDLRQPLMRAFCMKLSPLEIGLHDQLSCGELATVLRDLRTWQKEGRCCLAIPETYHSLQLQYRFALDMRDEEKVNLLSQILAFLKTETVFMVDEGHRNADSLWQAIITHGKPSSLPVDEQQLFVDTYLALVGCIEKDEDPLTLQDGRLLSGVVQLAENGQARMSKADLDAVLNSLKVFFLNYAPLAIKDEERAEIEAYWLSRACPKPATIAARRSSDNPIEKRQEQLIVLVRGLLLDLLPKALGMVDEMDYGISLRPDDDTVSPRKNKTASLSQYESPDMSSPLTAQRLLQRGLNLRQMRRLVQTHVREHLEELDQNPPLSTSTPDELDQEKAFSTAAAARFAQWNRHLDPSERMSLDILSANNNAQMERLCNLIGKQPGVVRWYLLECAMPQVQVYPEKFSSNYASLLDGSAITIVFSATLGILEQYLYEPAMIPQGDETRGFRDDMTFQANVVQRACHPRNSTLHWFNPCSAKDLFKKLYKKDAERFTNRIRGLVDIGGWTSQNTTAEVALQFLEFNYEKSLGFDGIVYISEPTNKSEESTPVLLRRNEDGTYQKDALQGSNLHTSLRTIGLAPEKLKLFKIFGPSQTTGTDLAFESNAELIVTFGEGITLWNQIQGIMRGRGFLKLLSDLQQGQGIIWVGYKKLQEQIPPDQKGEHSPKAIMAYGLNQQAKRLQEILRARAYLGIIHIVRNAVDRTIENASNVKEKIEHHHIHRKAFVDAIIRDTHDLYGDPMTMQSAADLLYQFTARFCSESHVVLSAEDIALVEGLIDQTSRIMQQMPSRESVNLSGEMTQHSQNVGQQVQENIAVESAIKNRTKLLRLRDFDDAEKVLSLQSTQLMQPQQPYGTDANTLFGTNIFAKDLYYSRNAIRIAEDTNRIEVGSQLLKPSQWYIDY